MDFIRCETGSLESSDCLVTIEPSNNFSIDIKSTVDRQFYNSILTDTKKTLEKWCKENNINNPPIKIIVDDRGALSFAIKARVYTALNRSANIV
jgi:citrate lyase subunit gamma (acyl carrier protein)